LLSFIIPSKSFVRGELRLALEVRRDEVGFGRRGEIANKYSWFSSHHSPSRTPVKSIVSKSIILKYNKIKGEDVSK
jgi:hypothetical protein